MNEWIVGIVGSIVGSLITLLIQIVVRWVREVRAPYTGTWEDKIYNSEGIIVKRDRWICRQRGEEVFGIIVRVFPNDQRHRQWLFLGRIRSNNLFGLYWSKDPSIPSFGSVYLHQSHDFKFRGHYLKFEDDIGDVGPVRIDLFRTDRGGLIAATE